MECADVPDVSNCGAKRWPLQCRVPRGNTVTVPAWVQHEQDGRRQQGLDSEMQVERNILSFSRVSVHGLITCEGSGDVVGVVTPLVGEVAQAFHDDRTQDLSQ